jgi:hypothetical protein
VTRPRPGAHRSALTRPAAEPAHAFFPASGSRRRLTSLSQPRDSGSASTEHLMAGDTPTFQAAACAGLALGETAVSELLLPK